MFMAHHNTLAIKSTPIMNLPTAAGLFVFGGAGFTGVSAGATAAPVVEGSGVDVRAFPQD